MRGKGGQKIKEGYRNIMYNVEIRVGNIIISMYDDQRKRYWR